MKNLAVAVVLIFVFQLIVSCSGSQEAVSYSYEKLDQKRQDAYTEVWTYRYSVAEEPWQEVKIYVKNEQLTYIINVGTYFGHQENRYVYNSLKRPQNFVSQSRIEPGTVYSLEEAVEMALSWFVEDRNIMSTPNTKSN
ncbi:MAG: hypothetical protein IH784_06090 [Bacteroidetes bacterium]|nr:hypothetical protein [Bacteroidota bacterium]